VRLSITRALSLAVCALMGASSKSCVIEGVHGGASAREGCGSRGSGLFGRPLSRFGPSAVKGSGVAALELTAWSDCCARGHGRRPEVAGPAIDNSGGTAHCKVPFTTRANRRGRTHRTFSSCGRLRRCRRPGPSVHEANVTNTWRRPPRKRQAFLRTGRYVSNGRADDMTHAIPAFAAEESADAKQPTR